MKLATFNVENMFMRPAAMNLNTWQAGKKILEDCALLNDLISRPKYTDSVKQKILQTMAKYKGLVSSGSSDFINLQEVRLKLIKRASGGKPAAVAVNGRDDWGGWFELAEDAVSSAATMNTARVINDAAADVLCFVEVENRVTLKRFNDGFIKQFPVGAYQHLMLIDGNDERGIDVGIASRMEYPIIDIRSHVDDTDAKGIIFSRDCAEYTIQTPANAKLLVMINHLKSKGFGSQATSDEKRRRQAQRLKDIYLERLNEFELIAIVGDFNDVPTSSPLSPLLDPAVGLVDIMSHPNFQDDGHPGTFGNGTKSQKIDYILMSPALAATVKTGAIVRKGIWAGKNGKMFDPYPEVKTAKDAASDHACLWAEFTI